MEGFKISVNFLTSTKILTIIVFTLWPRGKRNKWRMDEGVDFFLRWFFFGREVVLSSHLWTPKKNMFWDVEILCEFFGIDKNFNISHFYPVQAWKKSLTCVKKKNIFDNSEHSENFVTSTKNSRVIIFTLYVGGKSCWWT